MTYVPANVEWSPADQPYAIAVSEAMWWRSAVRLEISRLEGPADNSAAPVGSKQIDARHLIFALAQLRAAAQLELQALIDLAIEPAVGEALSVALDNYLRALPGLQEMRNALAHVDEWAIGNGRGLQKADIAAGSQVRDVAAHYWGFAFDETDRVVRFGPFRLNLVSALQAATDLNRAINVAAHEVDRQRSHIGLTDQE